MSAMATPEGGTAPPPKKAGRFNPHFFRREPDGSVRLRMRFNSPEATLIEEASGSIPLLVWIHENLLDRALVHLRAARRAQGLSPTLPADAVQLREALTDSPRPNETRVNPHFFRREPDGSVALRVRFSSEEADLIEEAAGETPLLVYIHRILNERARFCIRERHKKTRGSPRGGE